MTDKETLMVPNEMKLHQQCLHNCVHYMHVGMVNLREGTIIRKHIYLAEAKVNEWGEGRRKR